MKASRIRPQRALAGSEMFGPVRNGPGTIDDKGERDRFRALSHPPLHPHPRPGMDNFSKVSPVEKKNVIGLFFSCTDESTGFRRFPSRAEDGSAGPGRAPVPRAALLFYPPGPSFNSGSAPTRSSEFRLRYLPHTTR